jgi:hypothetical protein
MRCDGSRVRLRAAFEEPTSRTGAHPYDGFLRSATIRPTLRAPTRTAKMAIRTASPIGTPGSELALAGETWFSDQGGQETLPVPNE